MSSKPDDSADSAALAAENALLRAELARLLNADNMYRAVLENAPVLISTKDLAGVVTSANRHFDVLDGYDADNFVGKSVFELFPPEIASALWRTDQRAVAECGPVKEELAVYHR